MTCAWQSFLNLLSFWIRPYTDRYRDTIQELRLRIGRPPEIKTSHGKFYIQRAVQKEDLLFTLNTASQYSPWAASTIAEGYITGAGGHRIGICGQAILNNGRVKGQKEPTSLCIRTARDITGISGDAANIPGSILILGPPGSGKTTLLRDLIRAKSEKNDIAVIDEKEELFPMINGCSCFNTGRGTDIYSGCPKVFGIRAMLKNMGPEIIAVDEITSADDCAALIHAGWCGVHLLATAHAFSVQDLLSRPVYRPLAETHLFTTVLVLQPDKTWKEERIGI